MKNRIAFINLFVAAFLWLNLGNVMAQRCLVGEVIDSMSGKPVEGAYVRLGQDLGGISGNGGMFRICNVPQGQKTMSVSCIGYDTRSYPLDESLFGGIITKFYLLPANIRINEVVITATRTENSLKNLPVRVNVIPTSMIRQQATQTIDDVLRTVPGIQVDRPFGIFSSKATVSMRGLSGKEQARFLVLLDGIPLNKSDGGTVDWNMIDPESISRIEILKGSGSALYGGNAMGGIVNMISSIPDKPLEGKLTLSAGTFDTYAGRLFLGGKWKMDRPQRYFWWSAGAFYRQSDGYITQPESEVKANPYIVKSNVKELGTFLKTGFSFNQNHKLDLRLSLYDDNRGTGEKVYQPDGNVTEHDSYGINLTYKGKTSLFDIQSSLFLQQENYKKLNEYLKDDYTWYNVLSVRRDLGWINTFSRQLGSHHLMTGGLEYKLGSVDAKDEYYTSTDIVYNEGKMGTFAAYLQDEVRWMNDRLRLIAGVRYDHARYFNGSFRIEAPTKETSFMEGYQVPDMPLETWTALSPRLSLQYALKNQNRVYLLLSRGFRPSNLDDLCRSGRIKGGFKIANPELEPEYLNNIETGIDLRICKGLTGSVSAYYSRGNDFQYYVSNGQTIDMGFGDRPIFIRANISQVEILGAETELKYTLNDHLSAFVSGSYNHSVISGYEPVTGADTVDLEGKFLTDVPPVMFSGGTTYNSHWINATLFFRYTDKMYINDQNIYDEIVGSRFYAAYSTLDLKIWRYWKNKVKTGLEIQNLMDTKYYDSKESVCPGRFITFELGYTL